MGDISVPAPLQALQSRTLTEGWSFKETGTKEWLPVKRVPTNVHLDLLDNEKIQDPFRGFNELDCEWVNKKSWTYSVAMPPLPAEEDGTKHVLVFEGLDTFATVRLDGNIILKSDNMWIVHRVDVTDHLHPGRSSTLEIDFKSAMVEAQKIKDAHPEHKWVGFNGDMARLAVRKAQYHWGWDWGPILSPCGPWRPVRLETYHARIEDIRIDYEVDGGFKTVHGSITATAEGGEADLVTIMVSLHGKEISTRSERVVGKGHVSMDFRINDAKLWFPHGYGEQPLYDISAKVHSIDGFELHTLSKKIGFRQADLVQEPDEVGKSFYFRVNGIDVFCGGSDWIPADNFTPRITKDKYRRWLTSMVDGHQVMIRIWGGGIWEEDVFYDTCDELGILVWQDFMFGCGNYPCFPKILQSIEAETVCQTKRLRHHPAIVLYAGNNEDYQVQEQFGLTYDWEDKDPQSWLKTDFPARYIYEKLLPDVVAAHTPHVPYHPGSPWGDGKISSDATVGDMHQWNVWHGTQEKYQLYETLGGRFNSEFGMEAFPHIDTVKWFVTDPSQLYPQSHMIDFHNKADGHERRIATYTTENFRMETDLEKFIHLTQLSQAEAMMFGYRGWRKQWGQKRLCGGALLWQLNDCWPGTSWSIIDYFLRKKPSYYAVRRVLAPIAVAVKRAHHDWSVVHARPAKSLAYECWVASSKTAAVTATVELRFISISSGKDIKEKAVKKEVRIIANGTTEIFTGVVDNVNEEPHVLAARVFVDGKIVSRDADWPQPFKYLDFSQREVQVHQSVQRIDVSVGKPTKGLVFEEREGVLLEDSALDVMPGDPQTIKIRSLRADDKALKWTFLGAL